MSENKAPQLVKHVLGACCDEYKPVTAEQLDEWRRGEAHPSYAQLLALALVLYGDDLLTTDPHFIEMVSLWEQEAVQ